MRGRRNALPFNQRKDSALKLLDKLCNEDWYLQAERVAAYLSSDSEIDLMPVIEELNNRSVEITLPKVLSNKGQMQFLTWEPGQALEKNRYGISEPTKGEICEPSAHSIILAPLVAFDSLGTRIGMGGGYYDRLLANSDRASGSPLLVGVGYDFQQLEYLQVQPWDARLDAVVTDNQVILISSFLRN